MNANHAHSWEQTYSSQVPNKEKQTAVRVRKQSWITKGEKVLYSLVAFCVIIGCVYLISFSSSTDTLNRELQSLKQTVEKQHVQNKSLTNEVKQLSRPERITSIAKKNGFKIQETEVKQATAFNN